MCVPWVTSLMFVWLVELGRESQSRAVSQCGGTIATNTIVPSRVGYVILNSMRVIPSGYFTTVNVRTMPLCQ